MPEYKYLIIGGGMTADAAVGGIREVDAEGSIGVIGREPDPPYNRPPLSKGLWKGDALDTVWRGTAEKNASLHLGRTAVSLDTAHKIVQDDQGTAYRYEKLLLATGATPRRLPFDDGSVIYYRTIADFRNLRALADRGHRFAVIGGGFIGWELAAALAMNGREVVMLFPEDAIGARLYPADLARFLNDYYRQKGVNVLPGSTVAGLEKSGQGTTVRTRGQGEYVVDAVVAGIGVIPETALAKSAALQIENGIVVNEFLQTSNPDIYAAGDVANFPNPLLGEHLRVEHEDNANSMGRQAGLLMAGGMEPYQHLPFFYSDLFDLGYEAVGAIDARLDVVADWKEPYHEGVLYYLRGGRVRGVLLWNVWGQVDAARQLIADPGSFDAARLQGRLPA